MGQTPTWMGLLYNWVFLHHAPGLAWLTGMGENSHVNPLVHLRYGSNYTGNGKSPNLKRVKTVLAQRQHSCFWACTAQIPTEYVISALLVNVHQRYMTKTEKGPSLKNWYALVCFGFLWNNIQFHLFAEVVHLVDGEAANKYSHFQKAAARLVPNIPCLCDLLQSCFSLVMACLSFKWKDKMTKV